MCAPILWWCVSRGHLPVCHSATPAVSGAPSFAFCVGRMLGDALRVRDLRVQICSWTHVGKHPPGNCGTPFGPPQPPSALPSMPLSSTPVSIHELDLGFVIE